MYIIYMYDIVNIPLLYVCTYIANVSVYLYIYCLNIHIEEEEEKKNYSST